MEIEKFDTPDEPSVNSSDSAERKLARRLRIQRRLEVLKKQEGTDDAGPSVEKTQTEKQIETSAEVLEKLIVEGNEVVRNVKVANEARAQDRRAEDLAARKSLLKKLRDEADECAEEYRSVSAEWPAFLASKDPLDIHAGIESQSARCAEILERKDALVDELKKELDLADEKFTEDRKKQSEDVNLLIERIENQVSTVAKAYRKELNLIEEALSAERTSLVESVARRWDVLYRKRHEEEMRGLESRKATMLEYETEMRRVMTDHQEKYRSRKIELETECQNLELEVQRVKAICAINIEKLDYGYAVLKLREDENTIVKNQQRRRINKLQDVMNGLKKDYHDLEATTRSEIEKLSEQVRRARTSIVELDAKSRHFERVNEKQYFDIWDMNASRASELVEKILSADRIIHEQTLGLDWSPPVLPSFKRQDLPSYREALKQAEQRRADITETTKRLDVGKQRSRNSKTLNLERRLLNRILGQIADHTGFLVEDKLLELLAPHTHEENVIIRLDNVFQALGIDSVEQIDLLLDFFLPYAYCVSCANEGDDVSIPTGSGRGESSSETTPARNTEAEEPRNFHDRDEEPDGREETGSDGRTSDRSIAENEKIESVGTETDVSSESVVSTRNLTCPRGHLLEIRSVHVTKALRQFAENSRRINEAAPAANDKFTPSLSRKLTNEDVTNFWNGWRNVFPAERERLWDALLVGLEKYHDVLRERHSLNEQTQSLRRQNDELKKLLETYAIKPTNDSATPLGPRISKSTS